MPYIQQGRGTPHYEQLWEDMMQYTDFKSTEEIQTKLDIERWFSQQDTTAKKKGRQPFTSSYFRRSMKDALYSLQRKGRRATKREADSIVPSSTILKQRLGTQTIKEALNEMTAGLKERYVYYDKGTPKYKVLIKGDQERWRDLNTGRFTKKPKEART